jgi:hypothetical protein
MATEIFNALTLNFTIITQSDFWSGVGCFAYNTFHVWYIKVYAWKYILNQFIEAQTHLASNQEDFGPPLS